MESINWLLVFQVFFFTAVLLKAIASVIFFARQVIEGKQLTKISAFYGDQFNKVENRLNSLANLLGIMGSAGILLYYWR